MNAPRSYDDLIAQIMSKQDKNNPAFKTEEECRAQYAQWYPGLEVRYAELAAKGMFGPSQTYHTQRTVSWGHWNITFMDIQPDLTKNFGVIIGTVNFPVVNGMGPQDNRPGDKKRYYDMIDAWVDRAELPEGIVLKA